MPTTTPARIDAGWMNAIEALGCDLSPAEWAARIGCSPRTVRRLLRRRGWGAERHRGTVDSLGVYLCVPSRRAASAYEIAQRAGCDRSVAAERLGRLLRAGLVERTRDGWIRVAVEPARLALVAK